MSFSDELISTLLRGEDEDGAATPDRETWRRMATFLTEEIPGIRRFRHALMRDAIYEGLPYRRRRELHTRAGEAILAGAKEGPEDVAEVLSLHFFNAGRFGEAWIYSRIAGDRAWAKYANNAAMFYTRALEAGRRLGTEGRELAALYEVRGDARWRMGNSREAASDWRAARALVWGDAVRIAALLRKESETYDVEGRYVMALRTLTRARRLLDAVRGNEAARARATLTSHYAGKLQNQGRHAAAISEAKRALAEGESAGEPFAVARANLILGATHAELGRPESAVYNRRALEVFEELGELPGQAMVLNNWGITAYYAGRWDEAVDMWARARALYERLGDVSLAALATNNIGEVYSDQGRYEEAESCFREASRVWRAVGEELYGAVATGNKGRLLCRLGRIDEGIEVLEEARARFAALESPSWLVETDGRLAEALLFAGRAPAALDAAARALAGPEGDDAVQAPMLYRAQGYAHLQLAAVGLAQNALEESLRIARRQGTRFEIALTGLAMGDLASAVGEPQDEDLEAESRSLLESLGVISAPRVPAQTVLQGVGPS